MYQFGTAENYERNLIMKKILSAILSLTMILALVAAMGISASAKEGDVLYEVNFKGDDKYSPADFCMLKGDGTLSTTVSDDGKSATITYVGTAAGRAFWGGAIKGLTYGEGKNYTFSMKMAVATYTNDSGALASGNAGVFINMPTNTDAQYLLDLGYKSLVGYYGCPNMRHVMSYGAGGKAIGSIFYGDAYVTDAKYLSTVDAEGFVDIDFVVTGANVKVFINKVYIDEYDAFNTGLLEVAPNFGLSAYLYNPNASITIKDAVVYEGNTVKNPTYPDYYVEGASVTGYDKAKTGDVLFTADFSRNDTGFAPRFLAANGEKFNITLDPADKDYIKIEQDGSAEKGTYYGSIVEGLEVNSETRYTTEWKVKTGAKNTGFCFAVPTLHPFSNSFNIYGNFTTGNFATEHGSTKITNINDPGKEYVPVTDLANDADGYASFRVEMHGYKATIYYLNTEGKWINYNEIDMTNTTKATDGTAYPHETGFQLCVGFYLHNKGLVAEYKDINIYKGLLISDPEGKLDPVVTEPEVTEPEKPVPTGDSALTFAVIAVIALAGVAVVAKRREN
jgi:hypothetical protein